MTEHTLASSMTREEILKHLLAVEHEAHALLEQAAHLTPDPAERALYRRLAGREEQSLQDLEAEEGRLDAEAFVQRAMDV
jgi:rubrerythrin